MEEKDIESNFIDLTDLDLSDIRGIDRAVLREAIDKIMHEVERPNEAVAGFQSSI